MYPPRKVFDNTRLASQVDIDIHLIKIYISMIKAENIFIYGVILRTADKSLIDVFIVCFRKSREFSTCLLRDDILRRFYSDNGLRSLAHNDWVDMDVHM